jgi:RNA polymerase sigma-70 factor (ECF subfamily)
MPRVMASPPSGRVQSEAEATSADQGFGREEGAPPALAAPEFRDFYEAEQPGLFGAMCLLTGNRSEAEELTQEAFLKLWEHWDRIRLLESPPGYLYRTALNGFRMRRRRAKVAARHLVRRMSGTHPDEAALARHTVDRGLASITNRQRAAVVLTELLDYTPNEAAEVLRVSPATVRKLASLGKQALRIAIGELDE